MSSGLQLDGFPPNWSVVSSAPRKGAHEALENAVAAFRGCLLTGNFVVPCDLNAVGRIINVKHRNALSVWC